MLFDNILFHLILDSRCHDFNVTVKYVVMSENKNSNIVLRQRTTKKKNRENVDYSNDTISCVYFSVGGVIFVIEYYPIWFQFTDLFICIQLYLHKWLFSTNFPSHLTLPQLHFNFNIFMPRELWSLIWTIWRSMEKFMPTER